jgi:hypothetical protein
MVADSVAIHTTRGCIDKILRKNISPNFSFSKFFKKKSVSYIYCVCYPKKTLRENFN